MTETLDEQTRTDPTPEELLASATELVPLIRVEQDASEARGYYSQEIHEKFRDAQFYRLLSPKRYGGLEAGMDTFAKLIVEIGRGDPGTAWNLALGCGHAYTVGSFWPEKAQEEIFVNPTGYFRAPHRFLPMGTATPVPGGYRVSGTWDYCSGIRYSSHFKGNAMLTHADGSKEDVVVVVPAGHYEILDDWGGDSVLGMRSSGSSSVVIEDAFVPEHWVVPSTMRAGQFAGIAPGAALHDNGMYNGRIRLVYMLELASPVVGAAQAALDEFEEIITTKRTFKPPHVLRYQDANFQRDFGRVMTLAAAAKSLLITTAEEFMRRADRWYKDGVEITAPEDELLRQQAMRAGFMACEAVEIAWATASSSAAKKGQRMQRYFRDVAMFRQHVGTQHLAQATVMSKLYFDLSTEAPTN